MFFSCFRLYSHRCILFSELNRLGISRNLIDEHLLLGGGAYDREVRNAVAQAVIDFLFKSGKYKDI